jgi:hypothetical protein
MRSQELCGLLLALVAAAIGQSEALAGETADVEVGDASGPAPVRPCVDVRIGKAGGDRFDCLNAEMAQEADRAGGQQQVVQSIVDASLPSAPTRLGLYNQTATRERLGGNFGHSPYPQRPVYQSRNPLLH